MKLSFPSNEKYLMQHILHTLNSGWFKFGGYFHKQCLSYWQNGKGSFRSIIKILRSLEFTRNMSMSLTSYRENIVDIIWSVNKQKSASVMTACNAYLIGWLAFTLKGKGLSINMVGPLVAKRALRFSLRWWSCHFLWKP